MVLAQHLFTLDGFVGTFLHHGLLKKEGFQKVSNFFVGKSKTYRVSGGVQMRQQLRIDEVLDVVDHKIHYGLGYQVSASFGDDFHVRVDQVPNGLHLTFKLRIHRAQGVFFGFLQTKSASLVSALKAKQISASPLTPSWMRGMTNRREKLAAKNYEGSSVVVECL